MRTVEELEAEIKALKAELEIAKDRESGFHNGVVKVALMPSRRITRCKKPAYGLSIYTKHYDKWVRQDMGHEGEYEPYREGYVTVAMSENRDDVIEYLKKVKSDMEAIIEHADKEKKGERNGTESK